MKICFLAPASVIHTVRWVNAMAKKGHDVHLITMHDEELDKYDERVTVYHLKIPAPYGYYLNAVEAKRILKRLKPDLFHVHYASGYGTLARLVNYTPTLLSVWGSDVYLFPYESKKKEKTLRKNLTAADYITSTSIDMKRQTERFITKHIDVIPFGIDTTLFRPKNAKDDDTIVIGTVRKLEPVYGIDILIKTTARLIKYLQAEQHDQLAKRVRLKIVGKGPQHKELEMLAEEYKIQDVTEFVGHIANNQVVEQLNQMDIFTAFSRSESFGVAVLEASACELPVIVSNVGGLPEVVQQEETGFIHALDKTEDIVKSLAQLVLDSDKREQMGRKGRSFVKERYDWQGNVLEMEMTYKNILEREQ